MCEALDKLTEEEGVKLKEDVARLVAWKNRVTGGIMIISALMAFGMWMINRTMNSNDETMKELTTTMVDLRIELAGFRKEVQPFITAGPRFTQDNYDREIKASLADFRETIPTKAELQNLRDSDLNVKSATESNQRRIEAIERWMQDHSQAN